MAVKITVTILDLEKHFSSQVYADYLERVLELRKNASRNLEVATPELVPRLQEALKTLDKIRNLPDAMLRDYQARDDKLASGNK